ncbi:DUF5104 domain-containing protein [Anaerobium acetethylicum]|uniref:DUF5104 domain-containing protein n=1 Tax=Anaerobium acetethylicum TaxID=1619234 RepID=A0A1D3TWQ1_9FIRM|nr:DUF5104 domain-containing protein [Anaerobium acetethylicum]SCP98653.1 protein of unknown function [Anaerobium acetethylicum]
MDKLVRRGNATKIGKIFLSSFLCLIFLSLSGCVRSSGDYLTDEQITEQVSNELMEALVIEDLQAVKALLCPYFQETHSELDKEISGIFDFMDGDIISYDEPDGALSGGATTDWEWVEKSAIPEIVNIKTTGGKKYTISYMYYFINKENPELLGIAYINVVLNNDKDDTPIIQYIIDAEESGD